MSTDHWKLEKDLCRCCHSEGSFKVLSEPHRIGGEEEIYSEMLRHTIDVDLTPVEGPLCTATYTICETCIERLRDACNFKKQVLQCEKMFKDMYRKDFIKVAASGTNIKQEAPEPDDAMDEGRFDDSDEMDYNLVKCDEPPKVEIKEEKKPKARKAKPKAKKKKVVRSKKIKTEAGEPEEGGDGEPAEKKGGKTLRRPLFKLQDEDFKKDGNWYNCTRCEKRYDKILSLRYHVKTIHYKITKYSCPYCTEKFMTPAPLTIHKLQEHNIDDRFKCNACKGTFNTRVQLRKHINNFHMLGEKHKCDSCDYESFSFEGLYKHKFKHKTVKDYHCKYCRKSFLRKTTLDLHERIHTGDRRKICNVCGQAFVQKASLNYHMTKYHPEVNF